MAQASIDPALGHVRRLAASLRRMEQSDSELLRCFLGQNDQQAFAMLVKRHGPLVLAVCRRVLPRVQDAEDAFQATFLLLARRASGFREADSVGGWLHEVGYRMARNIRRAAARRRQHEIKATMSRPRPSGSEAARQELEAMLDEAISGLPAKYREPFVLCCLEDLSCAEVARRLHIKEGTIWSRLAEARRRLRKKLTQRGVTPGLAHGMAALGFHHALAGVPGELAARTAGAAMLLKCSPVVGVGAISSRVLVLLQSAGKPMMMTRSVLTSFLVLVLGSLGGLALGFPRGDGSPIPGEVAQMEAAPAFEDLPTKKSDADQSKPQGWLTGMVVGLDGKPVAQARVWVASWPEKSFRETTADATGRFRLGPLPVGSRARDLFAEAAGLARAYVPAPVVFADTDHDLGTIGLTRGKRYRGQVLLEDGTSAAQVAVTAEVCRLQLGHTLATIGYQYETKTNQEGRYELPPLPLGEVTVSFKRSDCQVGFISRKSLPGPAETLETVKLLNDVPFAGRVQDTQERPIAGATVTAYQGIDETRTDENGRFVLRGMGKNRPDVSGRVVKRGYGVAYLSLARPDPVITLPAAAYFYGQAIDAVTGQPVKLGRVVSCFCQRQPNGESQLSGCTDSSFEQLEDGKFRVAYATPGEYHLAVSAAGYEEAEAYTPRTTQIKDVQGIVIKLSPKGTKVQPEESANGLTGRVTREGRPLAHALVALWQLRGTMNAPNSYMLRGRTTTTPALVLDEAPVRLDGSYSLKVPNSGDNWCVAVSEAGQAPTIVGPMTLAMNERKTLNIECGRSGGLSGRVNRTPDGLEGHLWVVAFTKLGYRTEAPVVNGRYVFPALPPGEYGLKVGHDAFADRETETLFDQLITLKRELTKEEKTALDKQFKALSDPWKRARVVRVAEGKETADVDLELPDR